MTNIAATCLDCPLPPVDFDQRTVPTITINLGSTTLYRIHQAVHDPLFFTRRSLNQNVYRFDAPADEFGVLYASPSFDACMAEAVIRDKFVGSTLPLVLDESQLQARCVSEIGRASPAALKLADFTKPAIGLGFTTQVLSDPNYSAPNQWSRAVHDHPDQFDGIYFNSRYANEPSVAIFDRVDLVARGAPVALISHPETEPFLDAHNIALIP